MIDKQALAAAVSEYLKDTDYFPVEIKISPANDISVEIDRREGGVDIDFCAELTRHIEEQFDRDAEDYSLEVGSAGLTSPFKVREQWLKNIGNEVEVLGADGRKYRGTLTEAAEETFTVACPEKVKREGEKRPTIEEVEHTFRYEEPKYTKYILDIF